MIQVLLILLANPVPALGGYEKSPLMIMSLVSTGSQVHQPSFGVMSMIWLTCLPQPVHDLCSKIVSIRVTERGIKSLIHTTNSADFGFAHFIVVGS